MYIHLQERRCKYGNTACKMGKRTRNTLILQELDIRVNDTLSMEVRGEQIIIEKVKFKHRTLEERARAYDGKLGPYTEFDWGEPKGREVW